MQIQIEIRSRNEMRGLSLMGSSGLAGSILPLCRSSQEHRRHGSPGTVL
jgi:hypothetical protein